MSEKNSAFYYIGKQQQPLGYLKVNSGNAQTETQHEPAIEIERLYVLKAFQGQQVGQTLMNKAIELAKLQQVRFIWLGVWEKNLNAINFYQKNGFVEFGKHVFKLGSDEQTDIMMRLYI